MKGLAACLLLLSWGLAAADEQIDLYHSFDESRLGRIFLSPADRLRLERLRGASINEVLPRAQGDDLRDADATQAVAPTPGRRGAGIIVSGDRVPLVWANGAFAPRPGATAERLRSNSAARIQASAAGQAQDKASTDLKRANDLGADDAAQNGADSTKPDGQR